MDESISPEKEDDILQRSPAEHAAKGGDDKKVDSKDKHAPDSVAHEKEDSVLNLRQVSDISTERYTPASNKTSTPVEKDEVPRRSPEHPITEALPEEDAPSNTTAAPARKDGVPLPKPRHEPRKPEDQQRYLHQPQQPTMIIMGGPHDGRPMPAGAGRRPPPSSSSLIFAEAIVSIVGAFARIWIISYFAKWWSEEETLRPVQHFVWELLNDKFIKDDTTLQNVLHLPPANVSKRTWRRFLRRQHRAEGKVQKKTVLQPEAFQRTVVVLEIGGELNLPFLENTVTFIIRQHRQQAFGSIGGLAKEVEVVLLVNSPGGGVQEFGLAATQVGRLTQEGGLITTVCVDKVAASGGYMIASQANNLYAAPFAVVGSIGVIREGINIHDALEKHGVKGIVIKAGDEKVPLTMLGTVTKRDIASTQQTLDSMHTAFQELVVRGRPQLEDSVEEVCNGSIYLGETAEGLSLVDRVVTSEEYLLERIEAGDRVMKLHKVHQNIARRKTLFHPLDFLQEKGASLRAACNKWMASDLESTLSRAVAATSAIGVIKALVQYSVRFGGDT